MQKQSHISRYRGFTVLLASLLFVLGCGTGEYNALLDAAISSTPKEAAPVEVNGDADDGDRAERPRGGQTQLGGRQSTIGMAMSAGARVKALNNLGGIMQTILNYELQFGKYPSQAIVKDGQPMLSWRVELLKLTDKNLYDRFKLDEPWDSETNMALLDRMPSVYDVGYSLPEGHTALVAVVGPDTLFSSDPGRQRKNTDIRDGPQKTAAVIIANSGSAVPWTKPADLIMDSSDPSKGMAWPDDRFMAGFVDGTAQRVTNLDAGVIKAAFTINGNELENREDL